MIYTREAIETLLQGITPGVWKVRESPMGDGGFFVQAPRTNRTDPYDVEILAEDSTNYPTKRGDAEFIAAAPEIVRQLLRGLTP